jgi:predicted RND superfamily exporter protein
MSIVDYLKLMHHTMQAEPSSQALPDNEPLVAQYLLLYSMSGNEFRSMVDPAYRQAVIRAFVKRDDAEFGRSLLERVEDYAARRFQGLPATVRLAAGSLGIQTAMNESVVREKVINVCQVTAIIFVLSALALRSGVDGLLVLTPLLLAVAVNLGVMGWSGTSLSVATASITSMAISIGADFAIYLIYRIREELERSDDVEAALRASLLTSGKAIFFVSSAVVLGYLVLTLSSFSAWVHLGALTALMITVSALATVTVIPALVMVTRPAVFTPADRGEAALLEPRALAS